VRLLALLWLCLLALGGVAGAVEPRERLADPVLEARARAISKELRCLVCQNESIDDSSADLAHDLRVLLRERLTAGDSDQQVHNFLVSRFGQFVLLRPPIKPATYALWFGPPLVLLFAAVAVVARLRGRGGSEALTPLSDSERRRLARLIIEEDR
jgi:cytochrome c-type biogenesis protein CcmH